MQSTYTHRQVTFPDSINDVLVQNNYAMMEVHTIAVLPEPEGFPLAYWCDAEATVAIFRFKPKQSK